MSKWAIASELFQNQNRPELKNRDKFLNISVWIRVALSRESEVRLG
jgi:hypothetical protein